MPPVARSLAVVPRPQLAAATRLAVAAPLTAPFSSPFSAAARPSQQPSQLPCRHCHPFFLLRLPQHVSAAPRASSPPPGRRCYHSLDHPAEPSPQDRFSAEEQAILSAAYRHIPEHGFSDRALALGARDAGYPSISTAVLADGVFTLVRWHLVSQRVALAARCRAILDDAPAGPQTAPLSPADIAARAERIAWERLLGNKAVVGRWQEVREPGG